MIEITEEMFKKIKYVLIHMVGDILLCSKCGGGMLQTPLREEALNLWNEITEQGKPDINKNSSMYFCPLDGMPLNFLENSTEILSCTSCKRNYVIDHRNPLYETMMWFK